ncbi:acetyl-CoA carboxylase biotin carboxyl carrier protein [Lentibacillus amyloliquefaciens]|uniref:Biotin carboxyl carrier protein of acetyl-CoA carboxylase n=1 Tax=Lentibacillus amyloliquefaciens TaxID=1472767 RepID=A0A0U4FHD1_9BACI|nr:acetyl-CoA carboxylase biotin carboxyl carrier protein [Lentibacillus amyloliquefaciens]ALX48046.1 acetyl-CoA carboxylase biotin carboxyl carrier protein subunit [Lentibacillus amyloliquefaciens]
MLKVQEIRELIKLVDQSAIDEFTYESDGTSVSMKKSNGQTVSSANPKPAEAPEQPAEPVKTAEPEVKVEPKSENVPAEKPAEENTANFDHEIVSPMVGTFYAKPTPESDTYVKSGSKVEADTVVCIVEAMKLFNEIEAETTGEITEVLVEDGELVEYGQPLFRVKTK